MKKLICIAACLMAGFSFAGPHMLVPFTQTTVTNLIANPQVLTNEGGRVNGFLEGIAFDITTAAPTATVTIATVADINGASKTLWTGTVATDEYIPVRTLVFSTADSVATDAFASIPLCGDLITVSSYSSASTGGVSIVTSLETRIYVTDDR